MPRLPDIIFIFADQLRYQSLGYSGDENSVTPYIDQFSREAVDVDQAISGCSMCSPYRASLLTGKHIFGHGLIVNDMEMKDPYPSIAHELKSCGYQTGYIGKWHVFGSPKGKAERRSAYVPEINRLGFDYWKGAECSHNYMRSQYYNCSDPNPQFWEGYDAFAQTKDAISYLASHKGQGPFFLMLSWGPPHDPYDLAPEEYLSRFRNNDIVLRPNVPDKYSPFAKKNLCGYYSHINALDDCFKMIVECFKEMNIYDESIIVFTSDHGDMHFSQGLKTKMHPFDESVRVPFLIKLPKSWNIGHSRIHLPLDAQDIFPTLLGLIGKDIPSQVQGKDWSQYILGSCEPDGSEFGVLTMPVQYHELWRYNIKPYRGLRNARYTYVLNEDGPWLLFDNLADPYQMQNLAFQKSSSDLIEELSSALRLELLLNRRDAFLSSEDYVELYGIQAAHSHLTRGKQKSWHYYWNQ